jgi:hypothetical protein
VVEACIARTRHNVKYILGTKRKKNVHSMLEKECELGTDVLVIGTIKARIQAAIEARSYGVDIARVGGRHGTCLKKRGPHI